MPFEGMDVESVESLAGQLTHQGDRLAAAVSAITNLVDQIESVWQGHDALQFRDWWISQHRPALASAAEAVTGLGRAAANNANDQRAVSDSSHNVGGGAAASSGGTPDGPTSPGGSGFPDPFTISPFPIVDL